MTTQTPISDAVTNKGNGSTGAAIPAATAGSPAPLPQPRPESILRRTPTPVKSKEGKDATQTKVKTQKAAKKATTKVKAKAASAKAAPAKVPEGKKYCHRCDKTKSLNEFPHSKKNGALKPRFACIPCYKAYTKEATAKAAAKKAAGKKVTKVTKKKTKKPVVKAKTKTKKKTKKVGRPKQVKKIQRRAKAPRLTGDLRDLVNSLQLVKTKSMKRVKNLQAQAKALGVEITVAEKALTKIEKLISMASQSK